MNLRLLPLIAALGLNACTTLGPDYRLPGNAAIHRADLQGELPGGGDVISAPVPADWWKLYHEPALEHLVEQALAANSELRVAAANLSRADARVSEIEDLGNPHGSVDGDIQRVQVAGQQFLLTEKVPVVNFANLDIGLSYQLDLFGKLRRGVESARAEADASQAAADLARINVVARVVAAYTQICAANEERAVAQHSLDLQRQSLELTARMHAAGRGNQTDVTRSETQFKSLRAVLPRYEAVRQAGVYQLAMLTAQPAAALPAEVSACSHLPSLLQPLPVGDGAALLKRRPDVRQAERRLAAATARIGVATAELYPDVSLGVSTGLIGVLDDMGDPSTQHWGFGPLIHWSIPSDGARARVRQAEADSQAALAHFDAVVLNALRETQTALARYNAALQQRDALQDTAYSARQAAQQTHAFYQAGREGFLAELQAQRTLASIDEQLAASESQVTQAQIGLFMALGGGWQPHANSGSTD